MRASRAADSHRAVLLPLLILLASAPAWAEQELAVYPGAVHTRIGGDISIGGEFYRMAYFKTDDSIQKVADYFAKKWREEGYPTFIDGDDTDTIVSAFYTRQGLMRSILLRTHNGRTLGFTVLKDLWMKQAPAPRQGIVTLEGTLHASDVNFHDDPGGAQHRGHLVERTWDQTYKEVRARMEKQGFALAREHGGKQNGKQQITLEHAGKGEQVITVVTEVEENLTVVSQMSIGSDRPDLMPNDDAIRKRLERQAPPRKK